MMHYYTATNGHVTVFRSSALLYTRADFKADGDGAHDIKFATGQGRYAVSEVAIGEFGRLCLLQRDRKRSNRIVHPQDDWVWNDALADAITPTLWDKLP